MSKYSIADQPPAAERTAVHASKRSRTLLSSVPRQQRCLPSVPWQKHDLGDCRFLLDASRIRAWQKRRQRLQVSYHDASVCVIGSTGDGLQITVYLPKLHVPYYPRVADCTRCCSGAHCRCLRIARKTCQKSIIRTPIRMKFCSPSDPNPKTMLGDRR